jgi:drug/metabolite transporter (DMT)-like permease
MVLLVENVFVVALSFLFLREVPTALTIIGGMAVLTAATIVTLKGENA